MKHGHDRKMHQHQQRIQQHHLHYLYQFWHKLFTPIPVQVARVQQHRTAPPLLHPQFFLHLNVDPALLDSYQLSHGSQIQIEPLWQRITKELWRSWSWIIILRPRFLQIRTIIIRKNIKQHRLVLRWYLERGSVANGGSGFPIQFLKFWF